MYSFIRILVILTLVAVMVIPVVSAGNSIFKLSPGTMDVYGNSFISYQSLSNFGTQIRSVFNIGNNTGKYSPVVRAPKEVNTSTTLPMPPKIGTVIRDPIIGGWRYNFEGGGYERYYFESSGHYMKSTDMQSSIGAIANYGTWSTQGNNSYNLIEKTGACETYIYSPNQDLLYSTKFQNLVLFRYNMGESMTGIAHY